MLLRKPNFTKLFFKWQFQDLYLGNDPRLHPPPMGEVMSAGSMGSSRPRTLRHPPVSRLRQVQSQPHDPRIVLEGTGLEHITLRDIM